MLEEPMNTGEPRKSSANTSPDDQTSWAQVDLRARANSLLRSTSAMAACEKASVQA